MKILRLYDYNDTNEIARVTADIEIEVKRGLFCANFTKTVTLKMHNDVQSFWSEMSGAETISAHEGLQVGYAVKSNRDRLLEGESVSLV